MCSQNKILELYPWIDLGFVKTIINNSDSNKNLEVLTFHVENGVRDGQNFSSQTIRLVVNLSQNFTKHKMQRVYFMKICLQTDEFLKACAECLYYEKEIEVYTKILPAVDELLRSIDQPAQLAPKCYFTDLKRGVLVFEDLSAGHFFNVDQADGMDIHHLKLSLTTLAKWHATTAVLLLKRSELFQWTSKIMYKNSNIIEGFFKNIAKTVSSTAKNWSGFEKIAEKLINIPSHVYDNIYKEYSPMENGFNVLLHGDMWSNNIMFHYDQQGSPTDIRLVDFALCKHTNPSYDLTVLLYGSSQSRSITQSDRERLIQFYHSELVDLLVKLDYPLKLPTLIDIQTVVFRFDLYNSLIILFVIGLRYTEDSFSGGFIELTENAQKSEEKSVQMYSHPKCIDDLKYLLDLFDRRGYLDF